MSNDWRTKDDLDLNADDIEAMHAAGIPAQDYRWSLTTWADIAAERKRLERIPTSKLTYIEALRLALVQQMLDLPPAHFAILNRSRYERLLDWITGRDPSRRGPRYPWVIAAPANRRVDTMPSNTYAIQVEEYLAAIDATWPGQAQAARSEITRRAMTNPITYLEACQSVIGDLARGATFRPRRVDAPTDNPR